MEFQKLSAPSLKELFIRQIRESILSGQVSVGTRLPPERELARQMQVSRAVVNSGLTELELQGFLEIRPRQGVFVADYGRNGNISTLNAIMEYHSETLGRAEIRSILEVRRALEHLATDAAIENASAEDMDRLERLAANVEAAGSIHQTIEAAFAFHHELAVVGSNSILPLIYISFKPVVSQLWLRYCRRYGADSLFDSTRALAECVIARDREAAWRCTDEQLDNCIYGSRQIY
ncbi:MAG: Pyruvate dehydrogenase complex repressor [Eubacteriales bacterium]|jgi:GntR family transcriptional regulator, transcriptional repressor for pyruvate dehydrogenase complex